MSRADDNTPEVTSADQAMINRFASLNVKCSEIKFSMKVKEDYIKTLADAEEEVMMCMEDNGLMLSIGESFFPTDDTDVNTFFEDEREAQNKILSDLAAKLEKTDNEMQELKARLKAKFGNSINLDD